MRIKTECTGQYWLASVVICNTTVAMIGVSKRDAIDSLKTAMGD